MEIELKNLKGTCDFLPNEQIVRNKIMAVLRNNFEKYGYLPVETPILNSYDLLAYKYEEGAEILSEIYTLKDQGKRKLGLRYDLTVPFCKVIGLNKDLTLPFRRYEIGKVFRDGPVKLGRAREFYQCDIDVVGIDGRLIEVEQMLMVKNVFDELNIPVEIKWNNRKVMSGLLKLANISESLISNIIGLIDRLEKISYKELLEEFEKLEIKEEKVQEILQLFSYDLPTYVSKFQNAEIEVLKEGIQECVELQNLINQLGLENVCIFSPRLARGLSIYTGTVFEFFDKQKRIASSLGGGGRYNKIITEFMDNGQQYPAVGLCFGLEPIYVILSNQQQIAPVDVFIVPMGTEVECLTLASTLRANGVRVLVEMKNKKVKKSFEYANKTGIKYVIVVGSNEIESQTFALKNMFTGEQISVSLSEMLNILKN
ncbi:MAG: histidine--tRNA ligase [Clostridiales bacterium]|nr:histidine--tRNA ligase [Clostridiales bacterium]